MKAYYLLLSLLLLVACNHIDVVDDENTEEEKPVVPTTDDTADAITVEDVLSGKYMNQYVWVDGYIVGYINGTTISKATFSNEGASATNLLLATHAEETDVKNAIPVELPKDGLRGELNLSDHPENYQRRIRIYALCTTYFSVTGLKKPYQYQWIDHDTPTPELTMPIDYEATFAGEGR